MNSVDVEIIRAALYEATRRGLAPVAGLPVGEAHLALDRIAAVLPVDECDPKDDE